MSKLVPSLLGAAALVASLSAAQFASGDSLTGSAAQVAAAAQGNLVNRTAKADRPAGITPRTGETVVTRVGALEDTSVAVRITQPTLKRDGQASGKISRRPVACEAPASVLTEIAQRLESGRCVT